MSKQSDIREGIEGLLIDKYLTGTRLTVIDYTEIAGKIIDYLHDNDVVIKADKDLPAYTSRGEPNNLVRLGFGMARRDMLSAGYVQEVRQVVE